MKKYTLFFMSLVADLTMVANNLFSISSEMEDSQSKLNAFAYIGISKVIISLTVIVISLGVVILMRVPYYLYILILLFSFCIYWIGFVGIHKNVNVTDASGNKISKEQPSEKSSNTTFVRINNHIISEKKYLHAAISLKSVADEFSISKGYLSQLININAKKTFNDYINELRVKEAKRMLLDDSYSNYTIEFIGLECGFRSKSNFYTAFKKFSGQTPNQFKNVK